MAETQLDIQGMMCASCVARVERRLAKVEGVESVSVNIANHTGTVVHRGVESNALISAVEAAGYAAEVREANASKRTEPDTSLKELMLAGALSLPLIVISMFWHPRPGEVNWLLFALATPVTFWAGRHFHRNAWSAATHGTSTMDTLISVGSIAAWVTSVYGLLRYQDNAHHQSEHIYFEAGAGIIVLVMLGRYLEHRAKSRMSSAIEKLMGLAPKTAQRVLPSGEIEVVLLEKISVGDVLQLTAGERVAVDGVVVSGNSYVDESMLTGEPVPIEKQEGSALVAGSVNQDGALTYRAERVGAATMLAQIVRLVEHAQSSKSSMQRIADNVSSVFVPIVFVIALGTLVVSMLVGVPWEAALLRAVAVLVIACPCALGLATPTALIVGMGRGAELGILIKDGEVLERAGSIKTVLLDKTGTLTKGKPALTDIQPFGDHTRSDVLAIAAAVESGSAHPIAKAIISQAQEENVKVPEASEFETLRGIGVRAHVLGESYQLSRPSTVRPIPEIADLEAQGKTAFVLHQGDVIHAVFAISDVIDANSSEAVQDLRYLGVEPVMVTGDNRSAAMVIASQVGIQAVVAGVLPEGKAQVVAEYQQSGTVAMVGDGINDAPALALADVGIAMGHGTDIALESAGVTILKSDLRAVGQTIRLSRATLATIRGNLFWAMIYNVVMIPLAALGMLSPMLAAAAMAFSSTSVVLNSLRLKRFRP